MAVRVINLLTLSLKIRSNINGETRLSSKVKDVYI